MSDFPVVRQGDTFQREIVPGAIPTPRLLEAGGGEAYFVPNEGPSKDRIPGVWYLRDVGYESPTGEYIKVRVLRA